MARRRTPAWIEAEQKARYEADPMPRHLRGPRLLDVTDDPTDAPAIKSGDRAATRRLLGLPPLDDQ